MIDIEKQVQYSLNKVKSFAVGGCMRKRIGIVLMCGMLLVMGMTGCQKNEVKVEEEKNDSVKTEQVSMLMWK